MVEGVEAATLGRGWTWCDGAREAKSASYLLAACWRHDKIFGLSLQCANSQTLTKFLLFQTSFAAWPVRWIFSYVGCVGIMNHPLHYRPSNPSTNDLMSPSPWRLSSEINQRRPAIVVGIVQYSEPKTAVNPDCRCS